jgi:uncharacterized protein YndB with AHSA1/START domain
MTTTTTPDGTTTIEAPTDVPTIVLTRDFAATPAQLFRAHTDPELFARWQGPDGVDLVIDVWDARTGGSWRYVIKQRGPGEESENGFHGCFHTVREDRIVQTFTWEGIPDGVSLDTITFEEVEPGRTRVVTSAVVDSFETRDLILSSGMEVGVNDGYARLDAMLENGEV